jgi:hypothetical protein
MTEAWKVKLLGNLFLKLETKGKDGSPRKLIMLFISYLLPGVFIPLLIYKQSAVGGIDATGFDYTFLTYLFYSLILSFTIAAEFDSLVITKSEIDLLTSLPLDDKLIVRAKMFLIVRYVTIISLPLLVPGSVFYLLIMKSFPRTILYFFSGLIFCLFLVNVLLLMYSFAINNLKIKKIGTYTLILQVIFIFLLIISYQFISFTFTGRYGGANFSTYQKLLHNEDFTKFYPQAWFAFIPVKQSASGGFVFDYKVLVKATLPVFITYMSILSLRLYLTENYRKLREKFLGSRVLYLNEYAAGRRHAMFDFFTRAIQAVYIKNHIELASFGLMQNQFKRDKLMRVSIIPMIIIPAGLALFALITNQLPSPFGISPLANYFGVNPVFHISIFFTVLVVLNTAILGTRVTANKEASWIYNVYPLGSKRHFINGIRKFFVVYLIVPTCLILLAIFSLKIVFYKAFIHTLFIFTCANLYNSIFHFFSKSLPFTKENTLVNTLHRLGAIFFPMVFAVLCIAVQILVYKNISTAILAIAIIITITFWLNFFAFVKEKD